MRIRLWALLVCATWCLTANSATVTVTGFGAVGDGLHDDTGAIQAAIDALETQGGGTLVVPPGTYLLNSYSPSPHPWFFYNLRVGSNVTVQGSQGAKFLQGPKGRAPMPQGASQVRNTVLAFGTEEYIRDTFSNPAYNGGFYPLRATHVNDLSLTLSNSAQVSNFHVGDFVAIYSSSPADHIVPSEYTQITSVSPTGILGLASPLARSFANPIIANVTSLATVAVGVNNLTVQGAEPVAINEVFEFEADSNTFISDTSTGGGNTYGLNMNAIRWSTFTKNVFTSTAQANSLELPQNNSQNVVFASNTFNASAVGFGEYAAHWSLTQNTFSLHSTPDQGAGLSFGGLDVIFSYNTVQASASAMMPLVADYLGLNNEVQYAGQIRILNNVFNCTASNANCLQVVVPDTIVSNNQFSLNGSGQVILVQGPLPETVQIQNNSMYVQNGLGIVLNTPGSDHSVITCNIVAGNGQIGIYLTTSQATNSSQTLIAGNSIIGFTAPINRFGVVTSSTGPLCQEQ